MPQCQPTTVAAPRKIENSAPSSGNIAVARGARRRKPQANPPEPTPLTPKLKGFIDRVVVPILVKGYVEKLQSEKSDDSRLEKLRFPNDSD
jgi:hypothetical protein